MWKTIWHGSIMKNVQIAENVRRSVRLRLSVKIYLIIFIRIFQKRNVIIRKASIGKIDAFLDIMGSHSFRIMIFPVFFKPELKIN